MRLINIKYALTSLLLLISSTAHSETYQSNEMEFFINYSFSFDAKHKPEHKLSLSGYDYGSLGFNLPLASTSSSDSTRNNNDSVNTEKRPLELGGALAVITSLGIVSLIFNGSCH